MPLGLDRTDRSLLLGAAILVIVLAVASAFLAPTQRGGGRVGYPSSYSPSWDGAKAAYVLFDELGYEIERWNQAPTELEGDPSSQVLILANPLQTPTSEETAALRRFLERGGRIVATGEKAAEFLPGTHGFDEGEDFQDDSRFPAVLPSPLTSGAPEISMVRPEEWQPAQMEQLVVYGDKDTAAVVTYAVGKGRVIWWGSPSPLTNRGIKEPGNLALLLNSVGAKEDQTILWDEYFHGARANLWSYVARTPLPWVFAQLGLLLCFILLSYSRRYGAIRMPGKNSRLSPLEFVDTLGDLYTTGHAGSAAVRVAYHRLRFQLTRQLGLPTNVTAAELAQTANRTLGWEEQPLLGSLVRAERGARSINLEDSEALEIVQDLYEYATLLDTRYTQEEKRPQA